MGHMMGWPLPAFFHQSSNALVVAMIQFLLTLPIMLINRKYYAVGFKTLWHRSPNMDSLIAMGSGASLAYGVYALYKIADGHAEAMEFVANETTRYQGVPLKELKLKKGILIAVLVHNGRIIIPDGSAVISAGDTVIIVSRSHGILDINDIYDDALLDLGGVQ